MILYDYQCSDCGLRFEKFVKSTDAQSVVLCACCRAEARRMPSFGTLMGSASPGPSREQMPRSWAGLNNADPSTIAGWHKLATKRDKLEEKYPELAGDRRPVLAHEGIFSAQPLRYGDPLPPAPGTALGPKDIITK